MMILVGPFQLRIFYNFFRIFLYAEIVWVAKQIWSTVIQSLVWLLTR